MTEATARAHPNIALVKYWGKRDPVLNLPAVPSLSLTLGHWHTTTTVRWGTAADGVRLDDAPAPPAFADRVHRFLDLVDPGRPPCEVLTRGNFPLAAGLASSASGFAALAVAATAAAGQDRETSALSALARRGSGSACRSLYGGFVLWPAGTRPDGLDSHGVPLAPRDHWDVRMVVAIVATGAKEVGSTAGMQRCQATSPCWGSWVDGAGRDVDEAHAAVLARDLARLGPVMERSTFKMHATMHTAQPPLLYWLPGTVAVLHAVRMLRQRGVCAWATMDAGPQVKVLCEAADADAVATALRPHAEQVVVLPPGGPASRVDG